MLNYPNPPAFDLYCSAKNQQTSWLPVNIPISTSLFAFPKIGETLSCMMTCVIAELEWRLTEEDYFELLHPCSQLKAPRRSIMFSAVNIQRQMFKYLTLLCLTVLATLPFDLHKNIWIWCHQDVSKVLFYLWPGMNPWSLKTLFAKLQLKPVYKECSWPPAKVKQPNTSKYFAV